MDAVETGGHAMLTPGWLKRQIDKATKDIKTWPKWMREATKLDERNSRC